MSRGRSPRDISRAEGNLEVGGDVQPNTSRLEAVYVHSLIINPYRGVYQEIHPCRPGSIGSVKINTSLIMMRECLILHTFHLKSHPLHHHFFCLFLMLTHLLHLAGQNLIVRAVQCSTNMKYKRCEVLLTCSAKTSDASGPASVF